MKKVEQKAECIKCVHASSVVDKITPNDPDCIFCKILQMGRVANGERICHSFKKK